MCCSPWPDKSSQLTGDVANSTRLLFRLARLSGFSHSTLRLRASCSQRILRDMDFQIPNAYDCWVVRCLMNSKNSFVVALCMFTAFTTCLSLQAQGNRYVVFEAGKHGYINQEGELAIPINLQGTYVFHFSEGYAVFAEKAKPEPTKIPYVDKNRILRFVSPEKWGFIDTSGAVVISPQFEYVRDFSEGLAAVLFDPARSSQNCTDCEPNPVWGFIDKTGKTVIQPHYHAASSFSEGLAAVMNDNGKWGYIDTRGELVIPFLLESAGAFSEGLAPAAVNKRFGYINKRGSFVIKPQYAIAGRFSQELAAVRKGGKTDFMILGPAGGTWMFIGKDGKKRIDLPRKTQHASDFAEGLAVIEIDCHCGYVTPSGEVAIPPTFSSCEDFSEGLADVSENGKWRYIDNHGKVVLEVPYDRVHSFKNGLAAVEEGLSGPGQKFGYIDKHGKQVWKPQPAL